MHASILTARGSCAHPEERWLIVHMHTSMPSLQQDWGSSFPEEPIFSSREMSY